MSGGNVLNYMDVIGRKYPDVQVTCVGDPGIYSDLDWVGGQPLPVKSQLDSDRMDLLKEDMWLEIKAERDKRVEESGTKVGLKWFHSDIKSKQQQSILVQAAGLGLMVDGAIQWKTMDGSFVPMTRLLATQIFGAAITNETAIFAVAETHRKMMLLSSDPSNYNFSNGWPETFQEWKESQP